MPTLRTRLTRLTRFGACSALLLAACAANAADEVLYVPLRQAIDEATASGKLDGSVRFYMAGTGPTGQVVRANAVTNKKSNAFGKDHIQACVWTAQSALVQLQDAARQVGANTVTNLTSFYKKNVYKSPTDFECHVGTLMSGVALRGDLTRVGN